MSETEMVEQNDVDETIEDQDETQDAEEQEEDPAAGAVKALQAERKLRRAAEKRARELEAKANAKDLEPAEQALEEARREAREQAVTAANQRLLKAEVKAAAKGRLSDPADAFRFIDLEQFEVSDDGDIDASEIEQALDALLEEKPYLAAGGQKRFTQGADQGSKKPAGPAQLTRDDLSNMTPEQINQARREGRLNTLLGAKS